MYKDKYDATYFGEAIINASRALTEKFWLPTKSERIDGIEEWLTTVSATIGITKPIFKFIEGNEGIKLYQSTGGGQTMYDQTNHVVVIYLYRKFSIVTLFHEYRHAMQLSLTDLINVPDVEEDAREWSCSLYFNTDPERFMRAFTAGRLHFA